MNVAKVSGNYSYNNAVRNYATKGLRIDSKYKVPMYLPEDAYLYEVVMRL